MLIVVIITARFKSMESPSAPRPWPLLFVSPLPSSSSSGDLLVRSPRGSKGPRFCSMFMLDVASLMISDDVSLSFSAVITSIVVLFRQSSSSTWTLLSYQYQFSGFFAVTTTATTTTTTGDVVSLSLSGFGEFSSSLHLIIIFYYFLCFLFDFH